MSRSRIDGYRLTPAARADLAALWRYSAGRWSVAQADAYLLRIRRALELLLEQPELARERAEVSPPVRIHPCGAHLIVYRIESDHLAVIRIRHGREDWRGDPVGG